MDCWLYDTETGAARMIASNDGIGNCKLSPDARRAVAWRMQSRGNTNMYLLDLASEAEHLLTPHVGVALSNQAEFVDNDTLLISTNIEREFIALARVDIAADGTPGAVDYIAGRDDADLSSFELLADNKIALLWNAAGRSELAYLDLGSGEVTAGPELPTELAGGMEASADRSVLALTLSGSTSPANVWQLDTASGAFTQISASAHEGVDLDTLVRPELVVYTAHDGLQLSGWLYRAADTPGGEGAPPMVLSFHGGPEGQSRPSFRSIYQALVARGISVFAPNVRGSSGFGKTFVNLDNGALRFDGVKDIASTVDYVVASGLADPDRIGIMGGSYGGYMVMAGLTEYPDLFGAGANLFGVVNFETFFANTEPWMAAISTVEYGDPVKDKELLEQLSPIHKVDRVIAPTIVLHGANDTNVPVVEAEQVVDSLKQRGVPVKYVLFPDEGHGWRKTENRVTSDVEVVRWFETHL
jgi:dipeptidyl aminopeptidase/acylaminoacyl peptidase